MELTEIFFLSSLDRNYRREVAIECDTLIPYLKERVYWKGIYFALSNATREQKQRSSFLENVDIINAFDGIKALNKAPVLLNVIVRDGMAGMLAKELNHPLKVVDSKFLRCMSVGISVTSRGAPVVVQNVTVQNTRYGNGFVYEWIPTDAVRLCRVDPENVSFPLVLQASGDALPNNCSKVRVGVKGYISRETVMLLRQNENENVEKYWKLLGSNTREYSMLPSIRKVPCQYPDT